MNCRACLNAQAAGYSHCTAHRRGHTYAPSPSYVNPLEVAEEVIAFEIAEEIVEDIIDDIF